METRSLTLWRGVSILFSVEMQHKSPHERTPSAKLTFVVLSDAEKPSKTFKASRPQLVLLVLFGFVVVGTLSVLAMIGTPLGKLILPEYFSTQAEQLNRVRLLESKVENVQQQLSYLAAYNLRLRTALGDTGMFADTNSYESLSQPERQEARNVEPSAQETKPQAEMQQHELSNGPASEAQAEAPQRSVSHVSSADQSSLFPLLMPVQGFITRDVDYSIQHYGLDISAREGEPVVAPASGQVMFADWTLDGGNTLIIAHADNYVTIYKHCERILVSVGTKVSRGDVVGMVGSTGRTSTGPHLHFELWQDGINLDPETYLLAKN
jgi:murein DD-endopeptidase MepM/ murein hydrolase activator NlpD